MKLLDDLDKEPNDSRIKEFQKVLKQYVQNDIIIDDLHLISTYLTPVFKSSITLFPPSKKDYVKDKLRSKLNLIQHTTTINSTK